MRSPLKESMVIIMVINMVINMVIIMVIIITIMITMVNMSYLTDVSDEVALKGEPDKGDVALFL